MTVGAEDTILASWTEARGLLDEFLGNSRSVEAVAGLARALAGTLAAGGKALAAGNGGSLADAMHFAEECTGRFRADRRPLAVLACSDPTHLTCAANDFGFEEVFARWVTALGRPGDLFLALSTSGESENLVRAARAAREQGMVVAGLLGRGGGRLGPLCDLVVMAPGETSDRIQEIHMLVLHSVVEAAEKELGLA
ncbi:MAG: SIS domain-containing protein [Fimbriimonadaceae bacterium]|nr:SIS domain-containing protein [Fimbriimonadaceae bacterium]QYK57361.1 MAG: SIS domain-containing protein [Fimbriimonadaceae bacterium]